MTIVLQKFRHKCITLVSAMTPAIVKMVVSAVAPAVVKIVL